MKHIGFVSSKADPDVWLHESIRIDGMTQYYEYVLLYIDDCIVISDRPESILRKEIGKYFELKEESIGAPSQYLGGKLREIELETGQKCWAFGSKQYIDAAVTNVIDYLKKRNQVLAVKAATPLTSNYCPEVDVSEELGPQDAS